MEANCFYSIADTPPLVPSVIVLLQEMANVSMISGAVPGVR